MKIISKYAKWFWAEVRHIFRRPWTTERFVGLIFAGVVALIFIGLVSLALYARSLPPQKVPTTDEKIQAYCVATTEMRVEIQFETELWMLSNSPDAPNLTQRWYNGLTEKQKIALLKISHGVSPGCPWPPGQ